MQPALYPSKDPLSYHPTQGSFSKERLKMDQAPFVQGLLKEENISIFNTVSMSRFLKNP